MSGKVVAIKISETKGVMKKPIPIGNFIKDFGLEGDAHAGNWHLGTRLNLERAMKIGDELGGHIVTGHVDALV